MHLFNVYCIPTGCRAVYLNQEMRRKEETVRVVTCPAEGQSIRMGRITGHGNCALFCWERATNAQVPLLRREDLFLQHLGVLSGYRGRAAGISCLWGLALIKRVAVPRTTPPAGNAPHHALTQEPWDPT